MKLKNGLTNFGLLILSTLIALSLAELLFWIIHNPNGKLSPDLIWEAQKTNTVYDNNLEEIKIGETHFREGPIGDALQKGFLRMLFLGDSFTRGSGIKSREDRFTDIIETQLNRDAIAEALPFRVHIFNAGKGGTAPSDWVGYFNAIQRLYKPHVVFAVFFLRDGTRLGTSLKYNKQLINPIREKYMKMPLYNS